MSIDAWDAYNRRRSPRRMLVPDASTPLHDGPMEEGYRNLAVAVIRQAVADLRAANAQRRIVIRVQIAQGNLDRWLDATALDENTKAALRRKLRAL